MLFAMQHWQKQAIISRNNTVLMNFSPFMAIMRNTYQIHDSSAGDLVHIIGKKKRAKSKKIHQNKSGKLKSPHLSSGSSYSFSCCLTAILIATEPPMAHQVRTAREPLLPFQVMVKRRVTAIKVPLLMMGSTFISIFIIDLPCGQADHTILAESAVLQELAKQHNSIIISICLTVIRS